MRLPVCAWLLMAALCVTGPALGQEDEGRVQARPADESSGEEGTSEDDAVDGRAREGERPRARGLREKPVSRQFINAGISSTCSTTGACAS